MLRPSSSSWAHVRVDLRAAKPRLASDGASGATVVGFHRRTWRPNSQHSVSVTPVCRAVCVVLVCAVEYKGCWNGRKPVPERCSHSGWEPLVSLSSHRMAAHHHTATAPLRASTGLTARDNANSRSPSQKWSRSHFCVKGVGRRPPSQLVCDLRRQHAHHQPNHVPDLP